MSTTPVIEVDRLNLTYGDFHAVKDLSFQVRAGEPALLAGVARQVVERYRADPARVHVAGASSGAGTAIILAVTYLDVFATATSVAGGEYGLDQVDPDDPDSIPPLDTARQARAQMGEHARRVPLLVIQGERDEIVPPTATGIVIRPASRASNPRMLRR